MDASDAGEGAGEYRAFDAECESHQPCSGKGQTMSNKQLPAQGPVDVNVMHLEPAGGNVFLPHLMMITSVEFWRCAHGNKGFADGLEWVGCDSCAKDDPEAFSAFHEA